MLSGTINVLKPAGMTSHDVVGQIRRIYGIRKVGHLGTLDPLAAGVLPVFVGKATRLLEFAPHEPKVYRAEWIVGLETDTEDTSGVVQKTYPTDIAIETVDWERASRQFIGMIQQRPSAYSAVKVNGQKAYELARQNERVNLPLREVEILAMDEIEWTKPILRARVVCSSGTYIRALGRDWARSLGTGMAMSFLLRERFGPLWHVNQSWILEEIEANPEGVMEPPTVAISHLPKWELAVEDSRKFRQGQKLKQEGVGTEKLYSVWSRNQFLGVADYDRRTGLLRPRKVWVDTD